MTYRVLWTPHAEERLTATVSTASAPEVIAAAAREIDRQLATKPWRFGESRYDDVRIGFVRPLGIQFEIFDDVRTVIVYDVWRIDVKKP
jgi:hypothetical protein